MIFDTMEHVAMRSSLDALWMKQKVISQNIANYETPNYKTKSLQFEEVFNNAVNSTAKGGSYQFRARLTEQDDTTVRPDGNNVDLEKENLDLFRTYLQSVALNQKISGQFTQMKYVLTNFAR